jgi:hypothetical protein
MDCDNLARERYRFVARDRERIVPLNERAATLAIFTQIH